MLEVLLVLLLSVIPTIENRGAMLLGFSLGITDPFVYVLGTILNIIATKAYFSLFKDFKRFVPEKINKAVGENLNKNGPASFVLLIPSPMNGINAFTASIIANAFSFDMKKTFVFVTVGIILRGITTYAVLIGLFSLAEYAELTRWFYFLVVALFIPIIIAFIKPVYDSWKHKNKTEILLAIFFLICLVLTIIFPVTNTLSKFFIDPIAVGISNGKAISLFGFAFLFFIASLQKPWKNSKKYFIILMSAVQIITVLTYFICFSADSVPIENHLFKPSFFVSDGHSSYNDISHIHSSKPALIYPLTVFGYTPSEQVYDYGLMFLNYVPGQIYAVQFLLFAFAIFFAIRSASCFESKTKKIAFLISAFMLLKLSVDGGPFNIEFIIACSVLYFSLKKDTLSHKEIMDALSKTVIVLVPFSLLITWLQKDVNTSILTSISNVFFIDILRIFYIFSIVYLIYFIESKTKEKIRLVVIAAVIVLFAAVINKELNFNGMIHSIPLNNGDLIRIVSPYPYPESDSTQLNYFYLSTLVFHSEESGSNIGSLFSNTSYLAFLKFGVSVENKTCLSNVTHNDTYYVYGKVKRGEYTLPFANVSITPIENHSQAYVVSNQCMPSKNYWIADYLLSKSSEEKLIIIKK